MKAAQREKMQAACDLVAKRLGERVEAAAIIAELVEKHGGTHRPSWDVNRLRVAGVASSCTYSPDVGLLDNWRRNATVRLMGAQPEDGGQ
jgi:hypothetical protein